jgi:hypothetical protein
MSTVNKISTMGNFSEIIDRIKGEFNCSSDGEVAKLLGISKFSLSNYKARGNIPYEALFTFCIKEDISLDWLFTGKGELKKEALPRGGGDTGKKKTDLISSDLQVLPCIENHYHAGQQCKSLVISRDWLERELNADPEKLKMLKIFDDSMEPTLENGDQVILDSKYGEDGIALPDGIYALNINGQILVKRLQILPKGVLRIVSDNRSYEPYQISIEDTPEEIKIIGRVVWVGKVS